MVNVEYANAYSEVLEVLNHIPKSDYDKIPNNMIEVFTRNNNKEYEFNLDNFINEEKGKTENDFTQDLINLINNN